MNAVAIRDDTPKESKSRRFGFGYEENSPNSPSTQHAQAFFLKLLPQERNNLTLTLFETSYDPFVEFLNAHQDKILSIKSNIEPQPFPMESAIRIFIHCWSELSHQQTAVQLCDALSEWAGRWNLAHGWCLDHAIITLREQHLVSIAGGIAHSRFTKDAWETAFFWGPDTEAIFAQAALNEGFKRRGLDEFTFEHEQITFSLEGPFWGPVIQFRQEVRKEFEARGGRTVRGAAKFLEHKLHEYLNNVETVRVELGLEESRTRWALQEHLTWLLQYQVPTCKTFRQIGRDYGRDEATVREGIRKTAHLLGLSLRSADSDRRLGRPKGAKDKHPRLRAN